MECTNRMETALKKGDISQFWHQYSLDRAMVTDLQQTLFELSFRKELKYDDSYLPV